jgi:hypothetical protein
VVLLSGGAVRCVVHGALSSWPRSLTMTGSILVTFPPMKLFDPCMTASWVVGSWDLQRACYVASLWWLSVVW